MREVTVSIVSHDHERLTQSLVAQLMKWPQHIARVILTHNIPGDVYVKQGDYPFEITQIYNKVPKGFGENHNQAFKYCSTEYFCIMNPDISIIKDPFLELLSCFTGKSIAIVAPMIVNIRGEREDSARYFPTPWGLMKKVFGHYDGAYPLRGDQKQEFPDWIAGMFMLVDSAKFSGLSGFDESFFLYYEDVDLCVRAWKNGYAVTLCTNVNVVHDARRSSHHEFKFFKWHAKSALKYFIKHLGRLPK